MRVQWMVSVLVLVAVAALGMEEPNQDGNMLTDAEIIAFVGATDAEQAKSFYGDKLGLSLLREEPGHALVFQVGTTVLRVSLVPEVPPARFTVLGWKVEDINKTIDELAPKSVVFERFQGFDQDERAVWQTPDGARIAWFRDPDGNMLSLTQFPGAPSSTEQ